jgi:hypothetical protein
MARAATRQALAFVLAVVCTAGLITASDQTGGVPPIAQGRGAISGVVTDATSGRPVAGAIVALMTFGATPNIISGGARQVTDPSGRFLFIGLPAASFTISASRADYLDGGYGRPSSRAGNRRIQLADGEWFRNADVALWRQASITGTVRDETGEPVVGVWVRALARISVAGVTQWVSGPVTKTDDRGAYRFGRLTPGTWTVMVPSVQTAVPADTSIHVVSGLTPDLVMQMEAAGRTPTLRDDPSVAVEDGHRLLLGTAPTPPPAAAGRPRVYPITFHPSARALNDAQPIDTRILDRHQAVDVVLRPVPAFRLSGVVEGPPEATADLLLRLLPEGADRLGDGSEAATTLVGAGGRFTFFNVPAGKFTIVASRSISSYTYLPLDQIVGGSMPAPPGLGGSMSASAVATAPQDTMLRTVGRGEGTASHSARMDVELDGRDLGNVIVRLERGASISGRVVVESVSGGSAPAGLPLVNVSAESADGDPALGQRSASVNRAEPSPSFRIDGLQRGAYLLRVIGGGLVKSVVHDGRDYTYRPVDMSGGQDMSDVIVTVTSQRSRLTGFVRDAQGRPVTSGAVVIRFPAEREQWSRYGIRPAKLGSTTVGSDGGYQFVGLPAGDYLLVAVDDVHAESWQDPAFLAKVAASATRVSVAWGAERDQSLTLLQVK